MKGLYASDERREGEAGFKRMCFRLFLTELSPDRKGVLLYRAYGSRRTVGTTSCTVSFGITAQATSVSTVNGWNGIR